MLQSSILNIFPRGVEIVDNISAVTLADKAEIVLANETIYNYWQIFDNTYATIPAAKMADLYYPISINFKWCCNETASNYLIYISLKEDMSESICFVTNKTELSVENLFVGTTYYWQVDAVCADKTCRSELFSFKTADSVRTVRIDGVSNTRDIGGLSVANGNRIKQGMIYRGAKLEDITKEGKDILLYELGIKTDLDLRTPSEGGAGTKSPLGINYVNINGRYYAQQDSVGIHTEEGKVTIAKEIRVFTNPDNYPIYIHCSLGRDRTGTLVFLIEALLGLDEVTLIKDYELSMYSYAGSQDGQNPLSYIRYTYTYIDTNYEGNSFAEKTENYLLSAGITAEEISTLRSLLLEEVH